MLGGRADRIWCVMESKPRRTPKFWVQATGCLVAPFHRQGGRLWEGQVGQDGCVTLRCLVNKHGSWIDSSSEWRFHLQLEVRVLSASDGT